MLPSTHPATATLTCQVVTHVHWDREWYRPFEDFRARLVELVDQVCHQLDTGQLRFFHLDGQTITLLDVAALRPDLIDVVRRHVAAGRLTIGPWHVLADNQLVSGESMIRNLLAARRHGAVVGELTTVGYSPDAFGHPADLPRILRGFGIDTALVWRGAPDEHAQFRWQAPDGSEVFALNQRYHEAEVLWAQSTRDERLATFLSGEQARRPGGPWLLLNGGDHLAPQNAQPLADQLSEIGELSDGVRLIESSLPDAVAVVRAACPDPARVTGELRAVGGPGTFLLPGTVSTRVYLKQANSRAEAFLERAVEPLVALERLAAPADKRDDTPVAQLDYLWDLLLENSPHDSICGCSVDAVHQENEVRAERVRQLGHQVMQRCLLRRGYDPRVHGAPALTSTRIAVTVPPAAPGRALPVKVDVVIAPDRQVTALRGPDGHDVPVEVEDLGVQWVFGADLDLLPDSVQARVQRLRFLAAGIEPATTAVYEVALIEREEPAVGDDSVIEPAAGDRVDLDAWIPLSAGVRVQVADDASFSVDDGHGGPAHTGLARLVDGGDRGDTYTYDPPLTDTVVTAQASDLQVQHTPVRVVVRWTATVDIPVGLEAGRDARTPQTVRTPVSIELVQWVGRPGLDWFATIPNQSHDHRLRVHVPVAGSPGAWHAGQHFSQIERSFGPVLGELPTEPNREAGIGTHPTQGFAAAGVGGDRVAVLLDHVSEVQGLDPQGDRPAELAVTALRSVGWLSRFDLRTRTTGAGPALATPEAQVLREVTTRLGFLLGSDAQDSWQVAEAADARRAPVVAVQLRENTEIPAQDTTPTLQVRDAIVSALKPAQGTSGVVLRLSNPTGSAREATLTLDPAVRVTPARMDETALQDAGALTLTSSDSGTYRVPLAPWATVTLLLDR